MPPLPRTPIPETSIVDENDFDQSIQLASRGSLIQVSVETAGHPGRTLIVGDLGGCDLLLRRRRACSLTHLRLGCEILHCAAAFLSRIVDWGC